MVPRICLSTKAIVSSLSLTMLVRSVLVGARSRLRIGVVGSCHGERRAVLPILSSAAAFPVLPRQQFSVTTLDEVDEEVFADLDYEGDDDDDDSALEPYKALLVYSARASWRMTPASPPKALEAAQKRLLEATKISTRRKQTQPTLLRMIEAQLALRDRRERERRRIFQNKSYSKEDAEQAKSSPVVIHGPDQAVASVQHRLYPHFAMTKRVLLESQSLIPSFSPTRVLDFGAGCGSAAAAAWDVFGPSSSSMEWIHIIDASKTMREVTELLLNELVNYKAEEETSSQNPPSSPPRITSSAHMSTDSENVFDLCLSAFTLSELPDNGSILTAAALLYEKLRPGGLLVILEPGTPDGFANIRMVRNMLLDCCPPDGTDDACQIIAPCTHSGKCPMERNYGNRRERREAIKSRNAKPNDSESDQEEIDGASRGVDGSRIGFCSFVQSMPGGQTRRRGEKLSYLVVQKRLQEEETQPDEWERIGFAHHIRHRLRVTSPDDPVQEHLQEEVVDLRTRYLSSGHDDLGLELLRGHSNRSSYGRIIEAPKKRKGHVQINCCVDGRLELHKIPKSLNAVVPGIYGAARKSRWGGYWMRTEETEARGR